MDAELKKNKNNKLAAFLYDIAKVVFTVMVAGIFASVFTKSNAELMEIADKILVYCISGMAITIMLSWVSYHLTE